MRSRIKKDYIEKNRTFFIAEAGVNHNGNVQLAKDLIYAAKSAGADAVKFQTFKADRVISKFASKAQYQKTHLLKMGSNHTLSYCIWKSPRSSNRRRSFGLSEATSFAKNVCFVFCLVGSDTLHILPGVGHTLIPQA